MCIAIKVYVANWKGVAFPAGEVWECCLYRNFYYTKNSAFRVFLSMVFYDAATAAESRHNRAYCRLVQCERCSTVDEKLIHKCIFYKNCKDIGMCVITLKISNAV